MPPLKLVVAIGLGLLLPASRGAERAPTLILELNDSGRTHAWVTWTGPMPDSVGQALAETAGCPGTRPRAPMPDPRSVHVECRAPLQKNALRWTAHWDLRPLKQELGRLGVDRLEIHVSHSRTAFSHLDPASLFQAHEGSINDYYVAEASLNELNGLTLEAGISDAQVWRAAEVAALILLLPLVLLAVRPSGPILVMAAGQALFVLAATAWLWATLPLNVPASVPLPWNFLVLLAPLSAGASIGALLAGGAQRWLFLWRGIRAAAFVTLLPALLNVYSNMLAWALACLAVILICYWRVRRVTKHRLVTVSEGELPARVQQLAARAGARVKSVQILTGGEDPPAAFATRVGGIILTGGLLRALSRREVDAIVSHELSHVRHPSFVVPRGASILMAVAVVTAFLAPGMLSWMPLALPPAFLMYRAYRRRNERIADADAVTWSADGEAFVSGMVRVTKGHGTPLEWPWWTRPLMPHPATMERLRSAATRAGISEQRFQELLATEGPPPDTYPVPVPSGAEGVAFSSADRKRLNVRLSLVALAIPIAFGVAAPFIGYIAALIAGALAACLLPEWIISRQRMRARAQLSGRPGTFCAFSPAAEPRIYDGSFDYDWGFAAFEADRLVFRGDRSKWTVTRSELERTWIDGGPFNWMPRTGVCLRLKNGRTFCLRPLDGSFGWGAPRASARLLRAATEWQAAEGVESSGTGDFDFASVKGQPPPPYTWGTLMKGMPRYAAITLAVQWVALTAAGGNDLGNPGGLLGPVAVTAALTAFMAYPGVRRGKHSVLVSSAAASTGPTQ